MSISRRKFLKTKGAVLTLPFLHSFADVLGAPKKKDKPSKKLVIMYVPNGLVRRCFFPGEEKGYCPDLSAGLTRTRRRIKSVSKTSRVYIHWN